MAAPTPLITLRVVVRFSDCDPLGHVNNARYSTYLEQARIELWRRQSGFEFRNVMQGAARRGEGFILARTEIDFRSPAHDGDALDVKLYLEGFGRTSATYRYEIVDAGTSRLVVAAKTVQVWYDYETGRPAPLTDAAKERLSIPIEGLQTA